MQSGKNSDTTHKSAIIIGAGISGATVAKKLKEAGYRVTILEKNARVAGKMKSDKALGINGQALEIGAMVFTCNYGHIDTINKHRLPVAAVLQGQPKSVNQVLFGKSQVSFYEKLKFTGRLAIDYGKFAWEVWSYHRAVNNHRSPTSDVNLTFSEYAAKYKLNTLSSFLEIWVPGMGYGPLDHIRTDKVINYMGYGTIPALALGERLFGKSLYSVYQGFQTVVESMIENVEGIELHKSVHIDSIVRTEQGVSVHYYDKKTGKNHQTIHADLLVLAIPPNHWQDFSIQLSDLEQECTQKVSYIRYPVAVCDIKGFPNQQVFVPSALKSHGLNHIGFISTIDNRDNPEEGRRVVIYMNIDPQDKTFSLQDGEKGRDIMLNDLEELGFKREQVKIKKVKDWKDYSPTLPKDLENKLENMQGKNRTLYVGSYTGPYGFESVAACQSSAGIITDKFLGQQESTLTACYKNITRAYHFFFKFKPHLQTLKNPEVQQHNKLNH